VKPVLVAECFSSVVRLGIGYLAFGRAVGN
jgi:hypothetical protein